MSPEFVWLAAGLVTFAAGLAAGAWLSRADRGAAERVVELEAQVERLGERLQAEREAVAKHFDRTSDLFLDLTRDYTALYAHLAEGARDLCPDRTPEIGRGPGELPGLAAGPSPPAGSTPARMTPEAPEIETPAPASERDGAPVRTRPETDERPRSAAGPGGA